MNKMHQFLFTVSALMILCSASCSTLPPKQVGDGRLSANGASPITVESRDGRVYFRNTKHEHVYLRMKQGNTVSNITVRKGETLAEFAYGSAGICMCWHEVDPWPYCPKEVTVLAPVDAVWVFDETWGQFCGISF